MSLDTFTGPLYQIIWKNSRIFLFAFDLFTPKMLSDLNNVDSNFMKIQLKNFDYLAFSH